jgi:hypothetical protein
VGDIERLARERGAYLRERAGGVHESKPGHARGIDAVNRCSIDHGVARRGRDDVDVVSGSPQTVREVVEVQLDSTHARVKPIADESDLHVATAEAK